MNPTDSNPAGSGADLESVLSVVMQTRVCTAPDPLDLLSQLRFVSDLVKELPAPPAEPALVFRDHENNVRATPVGGGISVGRSKECEIHFPSADDLSRRHFQILPEQGHYLLTDAGSSNGTFVRGTSQRIQRRELRNGDIIKAGKFLFVFLQPT